MGRRGFRILGPLLVVAATAAACAPPRSTSPSEAAANPGSARTVCAKVADAVEDPVSTGPLNLYLDKPSPDHSFVITILDRSTAGELRYLGRTVCVTGQVQLGPEGPHIVVERAAQVSVSPEPVAQDEVSNLDARLQQVLRICGWISHYTPAPDSELEAEIELTPRDSPMPVLRVVVLDRRALALTESAQGRRACVNGFVRLDEQARPYVILRDPREFAVEG